MEFSTLIYIKGVLVASNFAYYLILDSTYTVTLGKTFEPILHCNAKFLTMGSRVDLDPIPNDFVVPVPTPTCWYPKSLVDPTRSLTDPMSAYNAQH